MAIRSAPYRAVRPTPPRLTGPANEQTRLRVAINLLTEDPNHPSGAHWFWTRLIPEMADRLHSGEQLHLMLSPSSRRLHPQYHGAVHHITYPWSNEHRVLRTASEHIYSPLRLPFSGIDVLNTSIAPLVNPRSALVIHMKTMHAFTAPNSLTVGARAYRRLNYQRTVRAADAIIINSNSLRTEMERYLEVDPGKLNLIYEAVDHDVFKPGDRSAAQRHVASYGVTKPFALFVSSLWPYKNCDGLFRAWALASRDVPGRQLAIVGPGRDARYLTQLQSLAAELGIGDEIVFVGGVPLEETARFYQAADVLVYPSLNETFGLPILEAMACACPVVTSNVSAMPEIAGGAAILTDPHDPAAIARSIVEALGSASDGLRTAGLRRAAQFNWGATAQATLDVYRDVADRRRQRQDRRR